MKKLILILLCVISAICFAQPEQYGPYDPGAMRTGQIAKTATGTAAAPAYSFSSDPDTGMYSAGANTLVLATDGANRVRVWPSGHVTINSETDDTVSSLQSYGAAPQTNFNTGISTSIYENLALSLRSQADGRPVTLQFSDNVNSAYYISHKEGNLYFGDGLNTNMTLTSGGNVLIATSTDDGSNKLQVNGFTKLGEAATGIKMKVLTGTTADTEGGAITIAHGLDVTKVISFSATVINGTTEAIAMDSTPAIIGAGYLFNCFLNATNAIVDLSDSDSENILSKTVLITIWYKE